METVLSVSEARERLTQLPEEFTRHPDLTIQVTRHGTPVMAVLPWDVYESIVETLEVMGDPELLAALRQSAAELARGEGIAWEAVRDELGRDA